MMGSPEDEPERGEGEGPQHWVTISDGFWMFDSPCTQALWQAVMSENPRRSLGPRRPVEAVSWDDCQRFIKNLNRQFPSLNLRLPTEAEWEYACRAGSPDSRYGELAEVAWYRDNSNDETHDVNQKEANAWGLHDMLGNVWEWCQDFAYRQYRDTAVKDPIFVDERSAPWCTAVVAGVVRPGLCGPPPGMRPPRRTLE